MRWIERFLDRDSDDEDDAESSSQHEVDESASASKFGVVFDHTPETVYPPGRGKMVPLLAYSDNTHMMSVWWLAVRTAERAAVACTRALVSALVPLRARCLCQEDLGAIPCNLLIGR